MALAWPLPDKPTYPDFEYLERHHNLSQSQVQHRNDKNVSESNSVSYKGIVISTSDAITKQSNTSTNYLIHPHGDANITNRISNYFKYLQSYKSDPPYFRNSSISNANYNRKVDYNNQNCTHHESISHYSNDNDNRKSCAYNSSNVHFPYSVAFGTGTPSNNVFHKYMIETLLKPWMKSSSLSHMKSTAIPAKLT